MKSRESEKVKIYLIQMKLARRVNLMQFWFAASAFDFDAFLWFARWTEECEWAPHAVAAMPSQPTRPNTAHENMETHNHYGDVWSVKKIINFLQIRLFCFGTTLADLMGFAELEKIQGFFCMCAHRWKSKSENCMEMASREKTSFILLCIGMLSVWKWKLWWMTIR